MTKKFQQARCNNNKLSTVGLSVGARGSRLRLDKFVVRYLKKLSRHEVQILIQRNQVTVNGKVKKAAFQLKQGDKVKIIYPEKIPFHIIPASILLPIIYDDQWLVAVNKPPGMLMHPVAGKLTNTLVNALAFSYPENDRPPQPVHRLDQDVSGIVLSAKTKEVAHLLCQMFYNHQITKKYLALLRGLLPTSSGTITKDITIIDQKGRRLRSAETRYKVLKYFKQFTLVLFQPVSGRRHQIRIHAQSMGHPIVGDLRYGDKEKFFHRPALHAVHITFSHPIHSKSMTFTAKLPEDFRFLLKELRKQETRE